MKLFPLTIAFNEGMLGGFGLDLLSDFGIMTHDS